MDGKRGVKLAAAGAAALAVTGGGAAVAASQLGSSPKEESQAVVADAANRLGVSPSKLGDALKKAVEDRVDAAVADGRLTKEQGDELKSRIEVGDVPLVLVPGLGPHGDHGRPGDFDFFGDLDAAASYLGLTEDALRSQLGGGKTLAQVAEDHGKTVDGLVQAIYGAKKKQLDEAVAAGRLTQADQNSALNGLEDRITSLVEGRFPAPPPDFRFRGRGVGEDLPPFAGNAA